MVLPALISAAITGAKVVGAFLASKTLAATAVKFVIAVALMKKFSKPPPGPDLERQRNRTNVRAAVSAARYVYGETRTGGAIAYAHADGADLWMVYAISKGACDSVTGLYIDGERQSISRSSGVVTITSGKYSGQVTLWEEFDATGSTSGAGVRALRNAAGSAWTTAHRGVGVSYIVARLTHTVRNNEGVFSGFPELSFVVKGRKITWPGQATAVWTENAAAIIYDYLRVRRGVPAAEIDDASFTEAFAICDAQVAVSRPDASYIDYPATEHRYSINGIIFADDDPDRMQTEFEFATRGNIYEWNGKFRIRVGANRTPTTAITGSDILKSPDSVSITTAPPISERVNVAVMGIDQSRHHDFQNYVAPEVADQAQIDRDGERLEKNLGTRLLINSPSALDRLLVGNLRRSRSSMSVTLRLTPGRLMKWLSLKPTELCTITESVAGLDGWQGEVSAVTLNEDMSVTAVFDEVADGEFDDDLGLGQIPGRAVAAPRVNDAPPQIAASDVTATARPRAGGGGTILWKASVTVPASFLGFFATLEIDGITLTDYTTGNTLEFDIDAYRESMRITVWRASKRGLAGPVTQVSVTPEYTSLALPRASLAQTWTQTGNDLLVTLRDPNTPIVKGAEFRYTFEPLTNALVPGTLTAATWQSASLLDAQTLLFKPNSNALFSLKFSVSGKYRVHARFVDAVGRYGPVSDLGYLTMAVPENPTHIIGGAPTWPGTLNNMHRFEFDGDTPLLPVPAGAPSTLTADEWDGKSGASFWPFGPVEGEDQAFDAATSTYYETSVLDLGQNKSGYFDVDFETFTPDEEAGASGASDDAPADAHDTAHRYEPVFTGLSMPNQTWQPHTQIERVFTPVADVAQGHLDYSVEGLPAGIEFSGGRLIGRFDNGPGASGVARITARAQNGAEAHEYFAWRVLGTPKITGKRGRLDTPHVFEAQGVADVRDLMADGATPGGDADLITWFSMPVPAHSTLEVTLTSPEGEDFDMLHGGTHYDSGARSETITLSNATGKKVREKVGVYRYALERDATLINRNVEGEVKPPVRLALAPAMPSGADIFDAWQAQQSGAGAQAVTGEFTADMTVFSAPNVADGVTPVFTQQSITPGQQVAVSSRRFFKGRIHVKKSRNRALKSVAFTFVEA